MHRLVRINGSSRRASRTATLDDAAASAIAVRLPVERHDVRLATDRAVGFDHALTQIRFMGSDDADSQHGSVASPRH